MAVTKSFAGSSYNLPLNREPKTSAWGVEVSNFLIALADNAIPKTGGLYTLSAELNLGATYGLLAPYLKSAAANVAAAGVLRLAKTDVLGWRNNANGADVTVGISATDKLIFGAAEVALRTDKLSAFAATTSAELAGVVSDETGSGKLAFATSPTLITPLIDDYLDLNEEAAPSTPVSGKGRMFVSTDGKLKFLNDDGLTKTLGDAGSGELNAVANPSDAAAGWTASAAGITVATTTTSTDLPLAGLSATAIKITPVSSTDYVRYRWTMPEALKGKKLKVEWYQRPLSGYATGDLKVEVHTNTQSDYAGTDATLSLSTDSSSVSAIPNATGKYTTTFDADSSDYLELRIVRTAGTTALNIANVIVGPGIQPQGAVVTPSVSWTPTGAWSTNTTYTGRYYRTGDKLSGTIQIALGGAPTSATLTVNLPSGLTINESALPFTSSMYSPKGQVWIYDASTSARYSGQVMVEQGQTGRITPVYDDNASVASKSITQAAPVTFASGDFIEIEFSGIPIAEWAGSGTVNLAQNDVEFAADDGSADVFGPNGALVPNQTATTGSTSRDFTFASPPQASDLYVVEIMESTAIPNWTPASSYMPFSAGNNSTTSNLYGIRGYWSSATVYRVQFGNQGDRVSSSAASAGASPWSTLYAAGMRFRVRKISGGNAVGFGLATSTQSGLIPTYVKGTFAPALVKSGGSGNITATPPTLNYARYVKVGSLCHVEFHYDPLTVTTNTVTLNFTLPFASKNAFYAVAANADNGTNGAGWILGNAGSATAAIRPNFTTGSWAVSAGVSAIRASFTYEVNET